MGRRIEEGKKSLVLRARSFTSLNGQCIWEGGSKGRIPGSF